MYIGVAQVEISKVYKGNSFQLKLLIILLKNGDCSITYKVNPITCIIEKNYTHNRIFFPHTNIIIFSEMLYKLLKCIKNASYYFK